MQLYAAWRIQKLSMKGAFYNDESPLDILSLVFVHTYTLGFLLLITSCAEG